MKSRPYDHDDFQLGARSRNRRTRRGTSKTSALPSLRHAASFGLAMTAALGLEAPLSFSVFSAAAGSLLLATCSSFRYSVDELLGRAATPSEGARRPA